MFRQGRKPTTPGEILREEFLAPLGITQRELADHIDCDYKVINRIVNGHASISVAMAAKLALAFETTPDFWLNAQIATDLWNLRKPRKRIDSLFDRME